MASPKHGLASKRGMHHVAAANADRRKVERLIVEDNFRACIEALVDARNDYSTEWDNLISYLLLQRMSKPLNEHDWSEADHEFVFHLYHKLVKDKLTDSLIANDTCRNSLIGLLAADIPIDPPSEILGLPKLSPRTLLYFTKNLGGLGGRQRITFLQSPSKETKDSKEYQANFKALLDTIAEDRCRFYSYASHDFSEEEHTVLKNHLLTSLYDKVRQDYLLTSDLDDESAYFHPVIFTVSELSPQAIRAIEEQPRAADFLEDAYAQFGMTNALRQYLLHFARDKTRQPTPREVFFHRYGEETCALEEAAAHNAAYKYFKGQVETDTLSLTDFKANDYYTTELLASAPIAGRAEMFVHRILQSIPTNGNSVGAASYLQRNPYAANTSISASAYKREVVEANELLRAARELDNDKREVVLPWLAKQLNEYAHASTVAVVKELVPRTMSQVVCVEDDFEHLVVDYASPQALCSAPASKWFTAPHNDHASSHLVSVAPKCPDCLRTHEEYSNKNYFTDEENSCMRELAWLVAEHDLFPERSNTLFPVSNQGDDTCWFDLYDHLDKELEQLRRRICKRLLSGYSSMFMHDLLFESCDSYEAGEELSDLLTQFNRTYKDLPDANDEVFFEMLMAHAFEEPFNFQYQRTDLHFQYVDHVANVFKELGVKATMGDKHA